MKFKQLCSSTDMEVETTYIKRRRHISSADPDGHRHLVPAGVPSELHAPACVERNKHIRIKMLSLPDSQILHLTFVLLKMAVLSMTQTVLKPEEHVRLFFKRKQISL
jgi:hypothetical protein